jgi:hypothetical protein
VRYLVTLHSSTWLYNYRLLQSHVRLSSSAHHLHPMYNQGFMVLETKAARLLSDRRVNQPVCPGCMGYYYSPFAPCISTNRNRSRSQSILCTTIKDSVHVAAYCRSHGARSPGLGMTANQKCIEEVRSSSRSSSTDIVWASIPCSPR